MGRPPNPDTKKREDYFDPAIIEGLPAAARVFRSKLIDYMPGPTSRTGQVGEMLPAFELGPFSSWRLNNASGPRGPIQLAEEILSTLQNDNAPINSHLSPAFPAAWAGDLSEDRKKLASLVERYISESKRRQRLLASNVISAAAEQAAQADEIYNQWVEITALDFASPLSSDAITEQSRRFLRGFDAGPWWVAEHVAVKRDAIVAGIFQKAQGSPVVFVHGPVGEGKSTLIRQTALRWLGHGHRVFALKSSDALNDPTFLREMRWQDEPLLILDDVPLTAELPPWLRPLRGDKHGCLLIGMQRRNLSRYRHFASGMHTDFLVKPPIADDANQFVDGIIARAAGREGLDRADMIAMFQDGLSTHPGGGLWCAQWQATRGEYLGQRIKRLVDEIASEPGKLGALAATVFMNVQMLHSADQKLKPLRSIILRLISNRDLSPSAISTDQDQLFHLGEILEGEFLGLDIDRARDPELAFRHPSVSHGVYRWIFGAARESEGEERLRKWPFFEAQARAMNDCGLGEEILGVIDQHSRAWVYDRRYTHFRAGMAAHPRFDTARACADLFQASGAANGTSEVDLRLARAALDGRLEGTGGYYPPQDVVEFGIDRLKVALADIVDASASALMEGAELMHHHNILFDADIASPERRWRYYATKAIAKDPSLQMAQRMFGLVATSPDVTPSELSIWCERAQFAHKTDWLPHNLLIIVDRLTRRFGNPPASSQFPVFVKGPHDKPELGSLRAIYRYFWKAGGTNERLFKYIAKHVAAEHDTQIMLHCQSILTKWINLDRNAPQEWPDGAVEALIAAGLSRDEWTSFFASYGQFFPEG